MILKLIEGQVHVKLEIFGEWHLVPLRENGPSYSAMIVKCFLASQCGVLLLILLTWCSILQGRGFPDITEIKNNIFLNCSFVHL